MLVTIDQLRTWRSIPAMFFDRAETFGVKPFLWAKQDKAFTPLNWSEVAEKTAKLAGALRNLGVQPGDRVVIVSENRPEWLIADMAVMAAGGVTVPAYITNTERDHLHILENSGAKLAFVSTAKLARALLPAAYQSGHCKHVIGFEGLRVGQDSGVELMLLGDLTAASATTVAEAKGWAAAQTRDDLACIIYTSGTGGAPRGVMLHHGALLHNVAAAAEVLQNDLGLDEEVFLSFLPLSHAYEHTCGQMLPIAIGAQIYYSEGLDKLAANIEESRPSIIVVVPRLFEVLRQRIARNAEKQGGFKYKMFQMALSYGIERYENDGALNFLADLLDKYVLERLVRTKVRERFGGRMKALVSGGAPLNPEVGKFFIGLGLTLLQGYGQTEAAPLISCNRPSRKIKLHTVGPALMDTEVKIAPDGEILVRGELVTRGYWNNPEETARILQDGWLHTGDIGVIDADGHIQITDRKKDIIVNDKGDNVSPQRVEGMLCLEPEILQAMVSGDKRPYLVGAIVPDPEWLLEWAKEKGKPAALAQLRRDPDLHKTLMAAVDRVNGRLSVIERVRNIIVASEAFSVDNEQMTPTLKIRRHVIKRVYGEELDALYG